MKIEAAATSTKPFRMARALALSLVLSLSSSVPAPAKPATGFTQFVASLWPLAEARGVSRRTFDAAFKGVAFNPRIVANTTKQAEFVRPVWQ